MSIWADCLNWGCIPTKALLRSAEVFHYLQHAKEYGLEAGNVGFNAKAIVDRSRGVAKRLNDGVAFLMKKNKIAVIWGEANVDAPGRITIKASTAAAPKGAPAPCAYQAKHIILATGARPRVLPGLEPDKKLVWTYFEAMVPERVPKSLLVVGSGAIGIEFASFFRTLGSEVTVVEVLPQILPVEDAEIAAFARKRFERQGIKILTGSKVAKLDKTGDGVTASIDDGKGKTQTFSVERVISAVGVVGNIENLGLEKFGVKTDRGAVVVDGYGRTNVPGIYAIGDVAGPPLLAHKAEHEGVVCIEAIKGLNPHPLDKLRIPGCTYLQPADRQRRPHRGEGKGAGPRDQGRPLSVRRQRQGHCAGRGPGTGEDDLRCQDRTAVGCAHGRCRGDRVDPGFRHRHATRDDRGRSNAHSLPASDAVGNDAPERPTRFREGDTRLMLHRRCRGLDVSGRVGHIQGRFAGLR